MCKSRDSFRTGVIVRAHCACYNFDIEVKGQGDTEFMNVSHTWYYGVTLMCQTK